MNDFMNLLNDDLNDVFYNNEEFGIKIQYLENGVEPGVELSCIFDSDPNIESVENSDIEYVDTRPRLRIRETDLPDGSPNINLGDQSDIFIVDGVRYICVDYFLTRTGETVCLLNEV
jgi:hypothetical protein